MYELIFRTRFERLFKKLDRKTQQRIIITLELLAEDPFSFPNVRPIAGVRERAFRLRIGRWRVLYFVLRKEQIIEVVDLFIKKGPEDYRKKF